MSFLGKRLKNLSNFLASSGGTFIWVGMFYLIILKLEVDPRSTPGHSKVLDQIRATMKLMIVVSTVGLTKNLLKCYGRNI